MRNWQNICIFKELGPVAIFSIPLRFNRIENDGSPPPGTELWEEYIIDFEYPNGWNKRIEWWLNPYLHYPIEQYYRDDIENALERVLEKFKPNIVVLSEIGFYPYLKTLKRHACKIVFDDHNIEALLFKENHGSAKKLKDKVRQFLKYRKVKAIERDLIQQVDQVWLCSEIDSQRLEHLYGNYHYLKVVPNGIDVTYYRNVYSGEIQASEALEPCPQTIIFVGSFGYTPNRVAVQWLIDEIFPRLQQAYPDCRLILAGSRPTEEMLEAARKNSHILVTGMVEDMRPYLASSSVVIVPLLQGGGTRLKILEAFAAKRTVVSTSKGSEGLNVIDGKHLLIHNDTDGLVRGVVELWDNPDQRQKLAQNALDLVKSQYSWDSIGHQVKSHAQDLLSYPNLQVRPTT